MLQIPVWTVYLVSLHYHHELSGAVFSLTDMLILLGLSLLASGAFYVNQVYDYESDLMNKKVMFLQENLLTKSALLWVFGLTAIVALVIGVFVSLLTASIFLSLLALAHLYSAPPARFKDRPVAALLANGIGHGLLISVAVMPGMTVHNMGLLGWDNPLYFALTVGGVYLVTTIPDVHGDRFMGKNTMAVWIGRRGTLALATVFQGSAALLAYSSGFLLLSILAVIASVLSMAAFTISGERIVLLSAKLPLLLLTLAACWFYPGYLIFLVVLVVSTRAYYRQRFGLTYPRLA